MRISHSAASAVLATALVVASTSIAFAHTKVTSTSPAKGKSAKTTITKATVTFTGPLRRGTLRVTGPGAEVVSLSKGGRDPRNINRLLVGLERSKRAGSYKASWTIVAADGHRQQGSFRFRLKR